MESPPQQGEQGEPEETPPVSAGNTVGIWSGTPVGLSAPFRYDLDGDGTSERYYFGVAFHNTLSGMNVLEDNQRLSAVSVTILLSPQ